MTRQFFATADDGTRLFVRTRSQQGEQLPALTALLCDGIACDGFIWKYLWDQLPAGLGVAHWNYRGHGRSASPADPAKIELIDHARDADLVRRAIGDGEVVIFGHSMGCQVALEAYRLRREKVRGLVLLCGSSGRITHTWKGTNVLAQVLPKLIERTSAHPEMARAIWSRMPTAAALRIALAIGEVDASRIRPEDIMPYMRHAIDIDLPMFLRMLYSAGEHSAEDLLPTIDVPVLVVAGERDTFTPPAFAQAMAAAIPGGELELVAGATHAAPIEQVDLVRERVLRFLEERVGFMPEQQGGAGAPPSVRPTSAAG